MLNVKPFFILVAMFFFIPKAEAYWDVPEYHPYYDAILWAQENNMMEGYSDGSFRPGASVNRAEFVKILTLKKYGQKMTDMCGSRMQFTDIPKGVWYEKYVCRAKDAHIISGYPDGTFRGDRPINFAEAAKVVVNTIFGETPQLRHDENWHTQYVQILSQVGAIPATLQGASDLVTRSEMVEMIYLLSTEENLSGNELLTHLISSDNEKAANKWQSYALREGFQYAIPPKPKYAWEWPPSIKVEYTGRLACEEGKSGLKTTSQKTIDNNLYCYSEWSEGATGQMYENYEYSTIKYGRLFRITFVFEFTNCGVYYGTPKIQTCEESQGAFREALDPDTLAHGILITIEPYSSTSIDASQTENSDYEKYCSAPPTETAIGRDEYPINTVKYGDIGYLGELFTADDCGSERISKLFGVSGGNYTLWPDVGLHNTPSTDLLSVLHSIGFEEGSTCNTPQSINNCKHWSLKKTVPISEILKLKPYVKVIKSSGCIYCG